ncbi:hypothetical protein AGMMS49992_28220 [Clostridia bacterium]|nr:hypothetical protein AGMMS49992_28220 [Clostridia bacterium]
MDPKYIQSYMKKKVAATGLFEDYAGTLHPGKLARVSLPGSIGAHGEPTFCYARRGANKHLAIMFSGGGASWNAETAKYPQTPESILGGKAPALYSIKADYGRHTPCQRIPANRVDSTSAA